MSVLAIDQGTTSTRALCVHDDGSTQITHVVRHRQLYPEAGWVEHDANELIASIEACIDASPAVDASAGEDGELARGVQRNVANPIVTRAR